MLRRAPGFTVSAILALALGIGANAAVFSIIDAVLLAPLPYRDPDRLIRLYERNQERGIDRGALSPATFVAWRARSRTLDGAGVYLAREWLVMMGQQYEHVKTGLVSPSVFQVLGVQPVLGRTFRPEEQQKPPLGDIDEVLIGYALWQRHYGGRADVLNRTLTVEGRSVKRIVGVMPPGFRFPEGAEIWWPQTFLRPLTPDQRQGRYHTAIARLRDGATIDEARMELAALSAQLAQERPESHAGFSADVERLDRATTGDVRAGLLMLLSVVGCLLLIACANVANLMIARAAVRRREFAVRTAIGATRRHLVRQSLAESALLSAGGLCIGLLLGWWGSRALVAAAPAGIPRLDEAGLDVRVFAFTAGIAVACAAVTAVVPALQVAATRVSETLQGMGRLAPARRGARKWIVAGEVALAVLLLIAATVLLRSFVRLRGVDLGFDTTRVVMADLRFPLARFGEIRGAWFRLAQAYNRILDDIRTLPDVEAVGGITGMPLTGESSAADFWLGDTPDPPPDARRRGHVSLGIVTPEYFAAMRIPVIRGRAFVDADRLSESVLTNPDVPRPRGVAIVNDAFARRYLPGQDPIGQSIKVAEHWAVSASTIVGVVGDVRAEAVTAPAPPEVFVPWGEIPGFRLAVAVRTRGEVATLAASLRARLQSLDPQLFVSNLRPLDDVVARAVARPRFNLLLVASFASLALALAAIGVYGVVAYLVAERTRELGIRIALGALARDVVRLVVGEGLRPVLVGLAAGVIAALGAVRLLRGLVFEIAPADPVSFVAAPLVLLVVATAAALIPARRATRVDPLVALREE